MKNRVLIIITLAIILIPAVVGLILWDHLPNEMAIHFNSDGTADKWCYKAWAVFGLPLLALSAQLFCLFTTYNDPKKIGGKLYNTVIWICPLCSVIGGVIVYTYSLGLKLTVLRFLQIAIGFMIIIIGNYLPKSKQNYTIGIRLPWTLNDIANWNSTHRFSGKVWILSGMILIINAFLNITAISIAIMSIIVLAPFVYSFVYHKLHN